MYEKARWRLCGGAKEGMMLAQKTVVAQARRGGGVVQEAGVARKE